KPLRRQEGSTATQQLVQRVARNPDGWQNTLACTIFEGQAHRAGPHLDGSCRRAEVIEHHRQALSFADRISLHIDELRGMRHRVEYDQKLGRKLQRQLRLLTGTQFEGIERYLLTDLVEIFWEVRTRGPKDLPHILKKRQFVGFVCGDLADSSADCEGYFYHLVERGLIARCTQRADIVVVLDRFQGRAAIEDAAATWAQYVPRQLKDPKPSSVEKGRNDRLLIESPSHRKINRFDAA